MADKKNIRDIVKECHNEMLDKDWQELVLINRVLLELLLSRSTINNGLIENTKQECKQIYDKEIATNTLNKIRWRKILFPWFALL